MNDAKVKRDDGGPAFPVRGFVADASGAFCGETVENKGITLLDYFAAAALPGLIARVDLLGWDGLAPQAYRIANQMLEARREREQTQ